MNGEAPWRSVMDEPLDWRDTGPIELLAADGKIKRGRIEVVDMRFNGTDEAPVHKLTLDDGKKASIFDFDKYRIGRTK